LFNPGKSDFGQSGLGEIDIADDPSQNLVADDVLIAKHRDHLPLGSQGFSANRAHVLGALVVRSRGRILEVMLLLTRIPFDAICGRVRGSDTTCHRA